MIIQHQSELPQNERELGWTKYYLELSYTGTGEYNCIASVSASKNLIEIRLNSLGEVQFGIDTILIHFLLQKTVWGDLKNALTYALKEEWEVICL